MSIGSRWRCVVCALALTLASGARAAGRMNVLFILTDDARPEMGCYGVQGIQTPNIDALAAAGVKFDRAYCQYPLCNPSRTSLLTGRYPAQTGVMDNTAYFRMAHPDWVTLPQHFKANGYVTVRCGKVFHGGIDDAVSWSEGAESRQRAPEEKPDPKKRQAGSDRIVVLEGGGQQHGDYKTTDQAIAWLEKFKADGRPFFLTCGLLKPHSPPTAPQRFFDQYDVASIPLPVDFAATPKATDHFPPRSVTPNGDLFIGREATEAQAREVKRAYWASVSWMDWNVGRVMAALDKSRLRDNTVVVFWGDHGYHLGEKGKWSKHGSLFEVGARVPLIVAVPGKAKGAASPRVIQMVDLYSTLVELCGLPAVEGLEGRSIAPLLGDPSAAWDHPAFTYAGNAKQPAIAVRTERWRYAEWPGANGGGAMLIDEQNDPNETKNLADEAALADVRKQMHALVSKMPGVAN